jgi:hypothetical protein
VASLTTHLGPTLVNRARNIIGPLPHVNYLQKSDWFSYPSSKPSELVDLYRYLEHVIDRERAREVEVDGRKIAA